MATKLWKDGKAEWFEAADVGRMVKGGWSAEDKPKAPKAPKKTSKAKE